VRKILSEEEGRDDKESEDRSGDESVRDEETPRTPIRDLKGKGRASTRSTTKVKSGTKAKS
jgi:hypothetical protein